MPLLVFLSQKGKPINSTLILRASVLIFLSNSLFDDKLLHFAYAGRWCWNWTVFWTLLFPKHPQMQTVPGHIRPLRTQHRRGETSSQSHIWMHLGALALGRWAQGFADSLRWLSTAQTTTAKDEEGKEDMGKGRDEATVMGTQTCWQPAKHSGWCVLWLQCRQCVPSNAKELHCGPVISWQQWQRRLFVWNLIPSAQTLLYTGPNSMESGPKLTKTNQAVTIIHPFFRLNQYKCFLIEFPDI